ncbi:MAG: Zn-dependent hydrolase [Cyclobacteriaceae bacterium]|nr:Zn-dependent hydrolase [Cyclobacteriaceae bacterium SS2]
MLKHLKFPFLLSLFVVGCSQPAPQEDNSQEFNFIDYKTVRLTTDLSKLADHEKQMIPLMIEAAKIMDELFWYESYGKGDSLLSAVNDEKLKNYIKINYGPWDRLQGFQSFIPGIGEKPAGANFYPADITKQEFEAFEGADKQSQYTFLRRNSEGKLYTIPYHEMFKDQITRAADLIRQSAELAQDPGFKKYLSLRSEALLTDEYQQSDFAWMDMKTNGLDLVIGPIENYEDKLYNYKTAHEAYVLVKDKEWSARLDKYASVLPSLQKGLPVPDAYKSEKPGSEADLNAYDVVYYAGDCNAGAKTIAINLPNDEQVQLEKGSRRLQLKNAIKAKFDEILIPIADELIVEEQRKYITFDAFFGTIMFHEVAHGLGIKNTIDGKGTVRKALKEHSSALEEGKADVLGLYMITQLLESGELEGQIEEYYTSFLAGIFRSVRFGAGSAHGIANMIRFNYFLEQEAFQRTEDGQYKIDFEKMAKASSALSEKILTLQGDGDYDGVDLLVKEKGVISPMLQNDLDRLSEKNIPVDIVFEQGVEVLGL